MTVSRITITTVQVKTLKPRKVKRLTQSHTVYPKPSSLPSAPRHGCEGQFDLYYRCIFPHVLQLSYFLKSRARLMILDIKFPNLDSVQSPLSCTLQFLS